MLAALSVAAIGLISCQPAGGAASSPTETKLFSPSPTLTPTIAPTAEAAPTLIVWLPPAFRPDEASPGGALLQKRIQAYQQLNPGLTIAIRVKGSTGSGGMRDSLAAAAAAAPEALPDVVVLDQSDLRAAAIKGLILPIDALLPESAWADDYPYAVSAATVSGRRYGLPLAGDAMVLAESSGWEGSETTWEQAASRIHPLYIPLGDPRALFLIFGYYAAGGGVFSSPVDAAVGVEPLQAELSWLRTLQNSEVLAARSLQIDSFESAYLALENSGDSAITMFSLAAQGGGTALGYLPTPSGAPFTLATGWSCATAADDPQRRARAASLLLWLTDAEFLAQWTHMLGVLPPSKNALAAWPAGARRILAGGISGSAMAFPEDEIANSVGGILLKAAREVLIDGIDPAAAAAEAASATGSS